MEGGEGGLGKVGRAWESKGESRMEKVITVCYKRGSF